MNRKTESECNNNDDKGTNQQGNPNIIKQRIRLYIKHEQRAHSVWYKHTHTAFHEQDVKRYEFAFVSKFMCFLHCDVWRSAVWCTDKRQKIVNNQSEQKKTYEKKLDRPTTTLHTESSKLYEKRFSEWHKKEETILNACMDCSPPRNRHTKCTDNGRLPYVHRHKITSPPLFFIRSHRYPVCLLVCVCLY